MNSLGAPGTFIGLHVRMSLFSWRNLMSVSSYLGSNVLPMWATLEGSSVDIGTYLLSASSGWMDVLEALESGMTGSEGDSAKDSFSSRSSVDAVNLLAISQLSLSQS
jgi:hypothetical protein